MKLMVAFTCLNAKLEHDHRRVLGACLSFLILKIKAMKIRPYFNPTSIIEMAKRSGYFEKIIETDISISYRVFKNKQTDILHIYYKK